MLRIVLIGICAVIFATSIKVFIADYYYVPSTSMEDGILPGEYVITNKLSYGPRWPQGPLDIPWFNLLSLFDHFAPWFQSTHWEYKRWPRLGEVCRDDVIIFEGPWRSKATVIKRCMALPGDIVELKADRLFVNGIFRKEPETVHYMYDCPKSQSVIQAIAGFDLGSQPFSFNQTDDKYRLRLNPATASEISNILAGDPLKVLPYLEGTTNNFGPILIPKKGGAINLNKYLHLLSFYVSIMRSYEGADVEIRGDSIFIEKKMDSVFTFNNNYYFFLGDNRHFSEDSRIWGFVPEQNIIGKATSILLSQDQLDNSFRWNRTIKRIK